MGAAERPNQPGAPALVALDHPPILPLLLAKAVLNSRGRNRSLPVGGPPDPGQPTPDGPANGPSTQGLSAWILSAAADLPAYGLRRPGVPVDEVRASDYARLCGFPVRDQLPPTYPHLLAFPLTVAYMAGPQFPLSLPGLVHIDNEITAAVPISSGATVDIEVWGADLRAHRSGAAVDIHSRVLLGGDEAWHGRSTYLARSRRSASSSADTATSASASSAVLAGQDHDTVPARPPATTWRLKADVGRRYARISGDLNPIHLHAVTARLFGRRAPIAHGMYTHARAVAAMIPRLPDQVRLRAQFRAPITVPQQVDLYLRHNGDRVLAELTAHGSDRVLMSTMASPLADG